jgi:predicted ArsR family transcriptional regulator
MTGEAPDNDRRRLTMTDGGSKTDAARSAAGAPGERGAPTPNERGAAPSSGRGTPAPRERGAPASSDRGEDVLSQPTRARLFARLASLERPAATTELAAELGLHPSGVRVHLERLCAAGLISRERLPQVRGRPRDGWRVAVDSRPAGQPPDAYPQLAAWLARSIPPTPAGLQEVERVGREAGRGLIAGRVGGERKQPPLRAPHDAKGSRGAEASPDMKASPGVKASRGIKASPGMQASPGIEAAAEAFGRALTALGFAPRRQHASRKRAVSYELRSCPYREAASENPRAVCTLHRGITLGMLDALAPAARLRRFVPHEPRSAGCLIEVEQL